MVIKATRQVIYKRPSNIGKIIKGTGKIMNQSKGQFSEDIPKTSRHFRKFEDSLKERLADTKYARVFLDVALEEYEKDGDTEAFLLALRDVAEAQGGITKLAEKTKLNRQNLYKILSEEGNPRLKTLGAVLHELGFRLSVEPIETKLIK